MKSENRNLVLLVAAALISFCAPSFAEDGQDHPMVNRYPGTSINHYDYKEFEEGQLLLSKPYEKDGQWVADKVLPLEGQVTYIHYTKPDTISALQIFRNYQSALNKSGFKELFVCNRPCTETNLSEFQKLLKARDLYLNYSRDNQYLSAQNGNVYVSMFVNEGGVWLFVIEKGEMATDKISVVGNSPIAEALNKSGRVDVYGLTFDTGKSTLKPSSQTTLKELAQILNDNPQMNLDVIGHTDNVGTPDSNLALSQERSDTVVATLVSDYGINPSRLNPIGKGQIQPIASNDNEKGKATNRRVEFVMQAPSMP
ncbi:MAG: hypothetical protein EOP48_21200, partial [Sphingobacteriales bacterium]